MTSSATPSRRRRQLRSLLLCPCYLRTTAAAQIFEGWTWAGRGHSNTPAVSAPREHLSGAFVAPFRSVLAGNWDPMAVQLTAPFDATRGERSSDEEGRRDLDFWTRPLSHGNHPAPISGYISLSSHGAGSGRRWVTFRSLPASSRPTCHTRHVLVCFRENLP